MKNPRKLWFQWMVVGFLSAMLFGLPLAAKEKKLCCVAGTYTGSQINTSRPNCPPPEKENFTMVIKQINCGANVSGTITDSSGLVNHWKGTLSKGPRNCCILNGSFLTPSGLTLKFQGTLCFNLGKWYGKGTWEEVDSPEPCKGSGTWEMTQKPLLLPVR